MFTPGDDEPILTNMMFQRGWFNHQLVPYLAGQISRSNFYFMVLWPSQLRSYLDTYHLSYPLIGPSIETSNHIVLRCFEILSEFFDTQSNLFQNFREYDLYCMVHNPGGHWHLGWGGQPKECLMSLIFYVMERREAIRLK